jgi:hypothetical protein
MADYDSPDAATSAPDKLPSADAAPEVASNVAAVSMESAADVVSVVAPKQEIVQEEPPQPKENESRAQTAIVSDVVQPYKITDYCVTNPSQALQAFEAVPGQSYVNNPEPYRFGHSINGVVQPKTSDTFLNAQGYIIQVNSREGYGVSKTYYHNMNEKYVSLIDRSNTFISNNESMNNCGLISKIAPTKTRFHIFE